MEKHLKEKLHSLRLYWSLENWDEFKNKLTEGKQSSYTLLLWLIEQEYARHNEIAQQNRF